MCRIAVFSGRIEFLPLVEISLLFKVLFCFGLNVTLVWNNLSLKPQFKKELLCK